MAEQHTNPSSLSGTDSDHTSKVGEAYRVSENAPDDEISLKELILNIRYWIAYLWTKKWTIVIAGLIGGALGLTYAFIKKPVYSAECTFVLEEGEKSSGISGYVGLASMMGIDLGSNGGGVFQGDNILQLYKSRRMIQQTLLSKDTFDGKQDLLINRFITFNKLREKWEEESLKKIDFKIPVEKFTLQHDSIVSKIVDGINKNHLQVAKPDKKLNIIKVVFKSKDEHFAKSFTDNIVANVNDFYIKTKTKKSSENLSILQHQADSVRRVLDSSISGVAYATDENPNSNPAFQRLRVPSQRKQIDVQANGAIYQEVVKNLEMAKVSFRREKPLIQVIDYPIFPLSKEKPGKFKFMVLIGLFSGFLSVLFLLIRKWYKGLEI